MTGELIYFVEYYSQLYSLSLKLYIINNIILQIYQTIKDRYFTVHVKNNSLDEALAKICPAGSECEYKLNEKLINELKKKYN